MQDEDSTRRKADELHDAGRIGEAIDLYSQLLTDHPDDYGLLTSRSAAYIELAEYDRAVHDAIAAYESNPESAAAAFNAGLALDLGGRTEDSVQWFRRACETDPSFGKAHVGLANALYDLGRFEEAVMEYDYAESCGVEFDSLYLYWGRALLEVGEYEEAARRFDAQYRADRRTAALCGAGQAAYLLGQTELAREMLERVVELDPEDHTALVYLMALRRDDGWTADQVEAALREAAEVELQ